MRNVASPRRASAPPNAGGSSEEKATEAASMEQGLSIGFLGDLLAAVVALTPRALSSNVVRQLLEDVGPPISDVELKMGASADAAARTGRDCQMTGCPTELVPDDGHGGVIADLATVAFSANAGVATTVAGAATMCPGHAGRGIISHS